MKWNSKAVLFSLLMTCKGLFLISCSSPNQAEPYMNVDINLHVMAYFDGDVRIDLNGKNVFTEAVRPNPILGYAVIEKTDKPAFSEIQAKAGRNRVGVWYNDSFIGDTTFIATDSTFLGVGLSRDIIFRVQDEPFLYW